MSAFLARKVVSSLPAELESSTVYFVRVGSGFDIYVTNETGTVVAYSVNKPTPAEIGAAEAEHEHAIADITGLQGALDGKAATSHNHDGTYAPASHGHSAGEISGLGTMATRNKGTIANLLAGNVDVGITADVIGAAFGGYDAINPSSWDWRGTGKQLKSLTLSANSTLQPPSNAIIGQTVMILVQGNNATGRTLSFHSYFTGALPTIADATSSKKYLLFVTCWATNQYTVVDRVCLGS